MKKPRIYPASSGDILVFAAYGYKTASLSLILRGFMACGITPTACINGNHVKMIFSLITYIVCSNGH